jgi:hypothetical protein
MGDAVTTATCDVYLEIGQKRVFAGALAWPGWARSARDEATALQALFGYAPRYAAVLAHTALLFREPENVSALNVVERLPGGAGTDFGAPGAVPAADIAADDTMTEAELARLEIVLVACWAAFDRAVTAASAPGRELRVGPRGGGRDVLKMVHHVREAEEAYLARLGGKAPAAPAGASDPDPHTDPLRRAILETLARAGAGEVPTQGPRGGARWGAHYFVRRAAWHALDHAWELEDRTVHV